MIKKIKLILQLLIFQLTARSQTPFEELSFHNPLESEFDSMLHEQVKTFFKKSKAPGLTIGISQDGKRSFYNYGYADTVSKKEFGRNTVFEVGSITKTFTANLLLQFDEKKKLSIEDAVSNFIPGVEKNDSILSKILLKNIASHTSGLPRLPANMDRVPGYTMMQPYSPYNREALYTFLKELRKTNPGKYEYSNLGFGLLATIMENLSKNSYEELLNKHLWKPLRMENSYVNAKSQNADSATGYFNGKPAEYWTFDTMAGAGAIKSNASDLLNYLEAHIETTDKEIRSAIEKIIQPVYRISPNMQIGYAWHIKEDLKYPVYWHNGGTYGFSTFAAFEPNTKTAIVIASNAFSVNSSVDKLAVDLMILLTGK